jgi:hypothetical protein
VIAFALALAYRVYRSVGTDDLDQMQSTDAAIMNLLLILPILIPMLTAILAVLFRDSRGAQRVISSLGAWALFAAAPAGR